MSEWPKHSDGRNKKMGEMTADERHAQTKAAVARLKREFEHPDWQSRGAKVLADFEKQTRQ